MADDKENASFAGSRSQEEIAMNIPADPDAHLTADEKADVVSTTDFTAPFGEPPGVLSLSEMLTLPGVPGPSSPVEAGHEAYAVALLPVLASISRPHQYW